MIESQPTVVVEKEALLDRVKVMFDEEYRLIQIGCTALENSVEVNYSFDKAYEFQNIRLVLPDLETEVPSISGIYLCAFLYENEIHDLFGIPIKDIAVDYKGKFYKTAVKFPFGKTRIEK